jgi:dienelactone hydrolase
VVANYHVDPDRIALMGFSMGGAGAWHLGAHYADRWAVVHAGPGFGEM